MGLSERSFLVTGAANGIGLAIARRLASGGSRVCGLDREGEALRQLEADLGGHGCVLAGDLRDEATVEAARALMTERFGGCDGLVNNAGIMLRKPLASVAPDEWRAVLEVNLTAPFRLVQALEPLLRSARGSVVNICSTRAHMSEPDTEGYAASKGGLLALTHALAISLGPEVRVNAISPGWIDVSGVGPGRDAEPLRPVDHAQHPAGRVGDPDDVAELAALLLDGDRTGFVTGAEWIVDGGMTRKMLYAE